MGLLLAGVASANTGNAQTWPSGTVRLVVPYPPGGSTDVIARLVQSGLQQRIGATIIVDNRAGPAALEPRQ